VGEEWFEFSEDYMFTEGYIGKELKLLADAQFPNPVVAEIRSAKIKIKKIPLSYDKRDDREVLRMAESDGRVLITLDDHFWNDKKFPLHFLKLGIIYIAERPSDHDRILQAFGLAYGCFAKKYPLDWWGQMKIRAVVSEFEIKMHTWKGKKEGYKMRLHRGRLFARETMK
jgi:hypothetical protein